jgi:LmbE family N-acetylglucosaminyl deacetylase
VLRDFLLARRTGNPETPMSDDIVRLQARTADSSRRLMPLDESHYLPYALSPLFPSPWVIFAPHPDDETYGMGGSIAEARESGIPVYIAVLTDGALGGAELQNLAEIREQEVGRALAVLGGAQSEFWRVPDRSLVPDYACIQSAARLIQAHAGGTAFFPSPVEPHPDHRATAVIAWEALRSTAFPMTPVSYEISVQGPCNRLLDISPRIDVKRRAMAVYQSQEADRPYARRVLALNQTRSWSLPDTVEFAEAFFQHERSELPLDQVLSRIQRRICEGLKWDNASSRREL